VAAVAAMVCPCSPAKAPTGALVERQVMLEESEPTASAEGRQFGDARLAEANDEARHLEAAAHREKAQTVFRRSACCPPLYVPLSRCHGRHTHTIDGNRAKCLS